MKMRGTRIAVLAVIVSIFFLPSFVPFEKTGNNMFELILNNTSVGIVSTPEEAQEFALEARRLVAGESEELVLVEANVETKGKEVLWGKVDEPSMVIDNMVQVLSADASETLHRSYVVKSMGFMVNLPTQNDVVKLLQAAIDKYDTEDKYRLNCFGSYRELPVLTKQIISEEEAWKVPEEVNTQAVLCRDYICFSKQSNLQWKRFEDYELGLIFYRLRRQHRSSGSLSNGGRAGRCRRSN